jgi:hypothetical protein
MTAKGRGARAKIISIHICNLSNAADWQKAEHTQYRKAISLTGLGGL